MTRTVFLALLPAVGTVLSSCAGRDNPVALDDLDVQAEFEIEAARVETLEEIEIAVRATHQGAPLNLRLAQLEIEPAVGGPAQRVTLEPGGEHYAAHVRFFQPGEHHLHFMAVPERHHLMKEMGEHEVEVHRAHRVIGPYWVELGLNPAPILEGSAAHLKIYGYVRNPDGTPGPPASGLEVHLALHSPDGQESVLAVAEEQPGEYEAEFTFAKAGTYQLHVEIEIDGAHEEAEFHVPVLSPGGEEAGTGKPGGHGHGS
ncbi:MAG: hypothetical protein KatS3mg081_1575 [Gemmatimonadales bacterium]|nr:MAG: hypothetical protein KatS3mg081_1575 [Gemmatimonadales bacterium]